MMTIVVPIAGLAIFVIGMAFGVMSRHFAGITSEQDACAQRQRAEAEYYLLKTKGICMECNRRDGDE